MKSSLYEIMEEKGKSNILFEELYLELFNKKIKFDSTNNANPRSIINSYTNYRKAPLKKKDYVLIQNYQIAHLHGRTKNPFFFTALWNISLIPRYLDPFTGHENSGSLADRVSNSFRQKIEKDNSEFIKDYRELFEKHITEDKINIALKKIRAKTRINSLSDKVFQDFEKEAKFNLIPPD